MKHGSLFSGIGGFDLAAEMAGWENIFHCEINNFCKQILKYYWPNAISYDDIKKTDFTIYRGKIDVITGGFPCQPYSLAGKRKGSEDDRHLWPEMLRAIREIQPPWIVGENVLGIVNWSGGLVFEQVQADLEAEGYEVQPFILPAASVNAPHNRNRVWFVAYSAGKRRNKRGNNWQGRHLQTNNGATPENYSERCKWILRAGQIGSDAAYTSGSEFQRRQQYRSPEKKRAPQGNSRRFSESICSKWQEFPTQSPVCGRNDGLPGELDGIAFSKWRNESIKGFGNAVVPLLVLEIFKAINEYTALSEK